MISVVFCKAVIGVSATYLSNKPGLFDVTSDRLTVDQNIEIVPEQSDSVNYVNPDNSSAGQWWLPRILRV